MVSAVVKVSASSIVHRNAAHKLTMRAPAAGYFLDDPNMQDSLLPAEGYYGFMAKKKAARTAGILLDSSMCSESSPKPKVKQASPGKRFKK